MHGDPASATRKAYKEQGPPGPVNRVTAAGFEQPGTYPRFLGPPLQEGDVVTAWLDLDHQLLSFSLNGEIMGDPMRGVEGPVVPAVSCTAATDCEVLIGNYRRWAPESGWARVAAEELGFTQEELQELRAAYRSHDPRGAGVPVDRLRDLFLSAGLVCSELEMADVIDKADSDGSGSLDLVEFLHLMLALKDQVRLRAFVWWGWGAIGWGRRCAAV